MPCDASYMNPNEKEKNSKQVAEFICYLLDTGKFEGWYNGSRVDEYRKAATDYYGDADLLDEMTAFLCKLIEHMNDDMKEAYLFNGRSKMARRLADWWDDHTEADRQRRKKEMLAEKREKVKHLDIPTTQEQAIKK